MKKETFLNFKVVALLLGVSSPNVLFAQESLQPIEGFETFARRRYEFRESEPFQLHLGNMEFNFRAFAGLTYDDNIYLTEDDEVDDWLLTAGFGFDGNWQISERNQLDITIGGLSYQKAFENSERDRFRLGSSGITYSHDWDYFSFNVYDRFSFSQDPADNNSAANLDSFGGLQNTIGVATLWNYDKVNWRLTYSHFNYISFSNSSDRLERATDTITAGALFNVASFLRAGPEFSAGLNDYVLSERNDSINYSIGFNSLLLLTEKIRANFRGGYSYYDLDASTTSPASTKGSWFATAGISHQYNSKISHFLGVGYSTKLGTYADLSESVSADYRLSIRYNSKISGGFTASVSNSIDIQGVNESPEYINITLSPDISVSLTDNLSLNFRYEFRERDADSGFQNYVRNQISLLANYRF